MSASLRLLKAFALILPAFAFLLSAVPCPAHAEEVSGWEITPIAGIHFGGGFDDNTTGAGLDVKDGGMFGFILGAPDSNDTRYEFFYGFQRTELTGSGTFGGGSLFDMDIHYFHIGGSYRYMEGKVRPFVAGGLGATHFSPRGDGPGAKTYFSLSLGVGGMVPLTDRVALRIEGRGFLTILPEETSVFCVSSGGGACVVNAQGDAFGQFLLLAGIVFSL